MLDDTTQFKQPGGSAACERLQSLGGRYGNYGTVTNMSMSDFEDVRAALKRGVTSLGCPLL